MKTTSQRMEPFTNTLLKVMAQVCNIKGCRTRIPSVWVPKFANHFWHFNIRAIQSMDAKEHTVIKKKTGYNRGDLFAYETSTHGNHFIGINSIQPIPIIPTHLIEFQLDLMNG